MSIERHETTVPVDVVFRTISHAQQHATTMNVSLPFKELEQLAAAPITPENIDQYNQSFSIAAAQLANYWEKVRPQVEEQFYATGTVNRLDAFIDLLQSTFPWQIAALHAFPDGNPLIDLPLLPLNAAVKPFFGLDSQFNPDTPLNAHQAQQVIGTLFKTTEQDKLPLMAIDETDSTVIYIADGQQVHTINVPPCRNERMHPQLKLAIEALVQAHSGAIGTLKTEMVYLEHGDAYRDRPSTIARRIKRERARMRLPSDAPLQSILHPDFAPLFPTVAIGDVMLTTPLALGDIAFDLANGRKVVDQKLFAADHPEDYICTVAKGRLTWQDALPDYNAVPAAIASSVALAYLRENGNGVPTIDTNGNNTAVYLPAVPGKNVFQFEPIVNALIAQLPPDITVETDIQTTEAGIYLVVTSK